MRISLVVLLLAACGPAVEPPDDAGSSGCSLRGGAYAGSAEQISGLDCPGLIIGDSIYEDGQIPIVITADAEDCTTLREDYTEDLCSVQYSESCESFDEEGFRVGDVRFEGTITVVSSTRAEGTVTITRDPLAEEPCTATFEVAWERR